MTTRAQAEDQALDRMLFELLGGFRNIRQGEIGEPVKEPTRVYRVEMPSGTGPFNDDSRPLAERHRIYDDLTKMEPGWPGWLLRTTPSMKREQMGITELAFVEYHGSGVYGCNSLASVNAWFPPPSREYLAKFSAKIVCYEVQAGDYILDLTDSHGEVVFAKDKAKVLEHLPITMEIPDAD